MLEHSNKFEIVGEVVGAKKRKVKDNGIVEVTIKTHHELAGKDKPFTFEQFPVITFWPGKSDTTARDVAAKLSRGELVRISGSISSAERHTQDGDAFRVPTVKGKEITVLPSTKKQEDADELW